MKSKLLVVAVIAGAFAWAVAPAAADTGGGSGGPGAAQVGVQSASTSQLAGAAALSNQNAVNANTPSNTAGGDVTTGPSSANQLAVSDADAKATNDADTKQKQDQTQNVDSGSCSVGCGGAGAAQIGAQLSDTTQNADSLAVSDQNAVNANSPVNVAGGDITSGPSSANQAAVSSADSKASNDADTKQTQDQNQYVGESKGSSCHVGCGGPGAAQIGAQLSDTTQAADSKAVSKQNAVNANVPVNIAGGDVTSGPSSANQAAVSSADSKAKNDAETKQKQDQTQNVGGNSSCSIGCGGAGGAQIGIQKAETDQWAGSAAISKQNAVNANVPVNIAGGDITSGPSSANQLAVSNADSKASNDAETKQKQDQTQNVGGNSSCFVGCGGAGAAQIGVQSADTQQWAGSAAISKQNAVNANVPVNIAGGDITSGPSSANQAAVSNADSKATNDAHTTQKQDQTQNVGGNSSCYIGCGGAGGAQIGIQKADTQQWAGSFALSDQNAVNANAPVNVAGGDITSGPSSANQLAVSNADSKATNDADTTQKQHQNQYVGGSSSCYVGCGAPGAAQIGIQKADTEQGAFSAALSLQNAVNSNTPHSVAGGSIYAGPSSANQFAFSNANSKARNDADTFQWASQYQNVG